MAILVLLPGHGPTLNVHSPFARRQYMKFGLESEKTFECNVKMSDNPKGSFFINILFLSIDIFI